MAVEFIPGTALPIHTGPGGLQPENRGALTDVTQGHVGPPLISVPDVPGTNLPGDIPLVAPHEHDVVAAALRLLERQGLRQERNSFEVVGDQTDPTTGNCIIPLHTVTEGWESHVTMVTVDVPGSASITPSAPLANAAIFAFLAKLSGGLSSDDSAVVAARRGMIAFAPTSAAGPVLPGQWTFNDTNAPILRGSETLYFVLVGGSQAAALNLALQVSVRMNHYSPTV